MEEVCIKPTRGSFAAVSNGVSSTNGHIDYTDAHTYGMHGYACFVVS
jgi:hypothetical protein